MSGSTNLKVEILEKASGNGSMQEAAYLFGFGLGMLITLKEQPVLLLLCWVSV